MIHPTAVIDPKAEIDGDVVIGPYALIEGPVQIASGTRIQGHAVITGSVRIGRDNQIGYASIIGAFPQDLSFDSNSVSGVEIGDNNTIREHCTIHRGTKAGTRTEVGSNNLLMVGVHLGHNVRLGSHTILANNVLLGGYAEVYNYAFIGGGSVVHQFTRLGAVSLLQGLTAVGKDVPPFAIAVGKDSIAGINVVGLRRRKYDPALRDEVKQAFKIFYGSGLNASQALEESRRHLWSEEVGLFWDFVSSSKRGICPMVRWTDVKREAANADNGTEIDHDRATLYAEDRQFTPMIHSTANSPGT